MIKGSRKIPTGAMQLVSKVLHKVQCESEDSSAKPEKSPSCCTEDNECSIQVVQHKAIRKSGNLATDICKQSRQNPIDGNCQKECYPDKSMMEFRI
ncbi:hypothetical protein NPIL_487011 [Nephila pilipes]|uniref:Uncharacterized protein n=1 Tax=Nephila pilipes TaxID=299642 RepID=A0A8X6U0K3_NEPPI|nr:hypothetical protein NPIL_300311 [Nephila pilipes]GFT67594.1 hypothetical protein NPIL_487011 [Nephila pilipes]